MAKFVYSTNSTQLKIDDSQLNSIVFLDIKRVLANFFASRLFGNGVSLTSENKEIEKFLNEWMEKNRFDDLVMQCESEASYNGRVIISLDRTTDGDIIPAVITTEFFQNVVKFEIHPFGAKFIRKRVIGLKTFFINETWTTKEVIRSFELENNGLSLVLDSNQIPDEIKLPLRERHNLGFVPFVEHLNMPYRNVILTQSSAALELQDDYPVRNIPILINSGIANWFLEEFYGGAKAFGNFSPQQIAQIRESGSLPGLERFMISTTMTPGQTKPVEIQPASFNAQPWTDSLKAKMNAYFIGAGASPIFNEQGYQTEAQTLISQDRTKMTMNMKRRRWQNVLTELFSKALVYYGKAENLDSAKELFSLEIRENLVYNEMQLIEFVNQAVATGLMAREEAIMRMRNLDNIEQAKEIKANIDKERESDMQVIQEQYPSGDDKLGALGQGKDPEKKVADSVK